MSPRPRILVVEDDPKTTATIKLYLDHANYEVLTADTGRKALESARKDRPDLLILDLNLPELDGIEVCRTLRRESAVPIIMLTARTTLDDKLQGLDGGADDYLPKPFSPRELMARIKAVLRRAAPEADHGPTMIRMKDLAIDFQSHEVTVKGKPVPLTPNEFKILAALARAPGRVFTRSQLAARAFGVEYGASDRTLDAHIMNLRRKIEPDRTSPTRIITVFGVGYRFAGRDDAP
ncbi:MAG: response regulator transcription factor [Acidobacteria bacterium]|nr:response regulator transcription factor [Acidobacteriota bacterium]